MDPTQFWLSDYNGRLSVLRDHYARMWNRFNWLLGVETALLGTKVTLREDGVVTPGLLIAGAATSAMWYVMGAEDRRLVEEYRGQIRNTFQNFKQSLSDDDPLKHSVDAYRVIGEIDHLNHVDFRGISSWRIRLLSATRLAALVPLMLATAWLSVLAMLLACKATATVSDGG